MKKNKKKKKRPTKITPKDRLFLMYMTRLGTETFNNATRSYIAAFRPDIESLSKIPAKNIDTGISEEKSEYDRAYDVCRTLGSRLFAKVDIKKAIDLQHLKLFGNHEMLDLRHAQLVFQDEDKGVALGALRDANKLKKRIGADEPPVPLGAQPITHVQIVMPGAAGVKPKVTQHSL